ncbi:succinate-semialdehyde dehydrogenase [Capronia epimyces CBS 606.96]|uniref:Succinate-semialdehyde dehydrogenase n=1 Tax=Capronia epimyces CBS 606.96 TaxID=1182542 RepID=W9X9Z8_9EURO|nr:succinate-semialdehyde dehydrogenase [Capronia epimyces CBS 606.96]EXJ77292.1 succinate-semialdehyde dehydrogenase [Capronia epimyces CBS 606.96]
MVLRKAGAELAAGCTRIVKPSPETPLAALVLADLAIKAGFEAAAVFNVLTTDLDNTPGLSEALCKHPLVSQVTFTGSTRVGQVITSHCAVGIEKLTLELGGNCPSIVFNNTDIDHAVDSSISLKWGNAGHACVTANRIYLQTEIHDQFLGKFLEKIGKL